MSTDTVRAAQVRWELQRAILQEEERRLVATLDECTRKGCVVPQAKFDHLRAARASCNRAFEELMNALERRGLARRDSNEARSGSA